MFLVLIFTLRLQFWCCLCLNVYVFGDCVDDCCCDWCLLCVSVLLFLVCLVVIVFVCVGVSVLAIAFVCFVLFRLFGYLIVLLGWY